MTKTENSNLEGSWKSTRSIEDTVQDIYKGDDCRLSAEILGEAHSDVHG